MQVDAFQLIFRVRVSSCTQVQSRRSESLSFSALSEADDILIGECIFLAGFEVWKVAPSRQSRSISSADRPTFNRHTGKHVAFRPVVTIGHLAIEVGRHEPSPARHSL